MFDAIGDVVEFLLVSLPWIALAVLLALGMGP
jgi:hypothetical protein